MANLEAQRLLDQVILDYMFIKGLHETIETFRREVFANQNFYAVNSSQEAFLQMWWNKFYETYNFVYPNVPMLNVESVDKVSLVVEDIVTNNVHTHQLNASNDHTMENTSNNVMDIPLSPDMLEWLEKEPILEASERMNEIDFEGPANALLASPELIDAGNNTSIQQAFHQEWPSNVTMHIQEEQFPGITTVSSPRQVVLPEGAVEYYYGNKLYHALTSVGDFLPSHIEGGNHAGVFGDTNQRNSWNELAEQQTMDSPERILRREGKQPMVETAGRKRKSPLSSLGLVEKEIGGPNNSIVVSTQKDKQKGFFLKNIHNYRATNIELLCCHFNTQGEFLATGGHDNKVMIWNLGNNDFSSREGHSQDITDIRFRPNSTMFATSSLDKTVKIWDAAEPTKTYRNLEGHHGHVMSVDYHPTMVDLLSSCDYNNEIRLWNVNGGDCMLSLKGGSRQVRFQPQLGSLLASSTNNIINIFDIETQTIQKTLQGHDGNILSICWDVTGKYIASVSEDSARIWSIREGMWIFELLSGVNKFQSCIYHPGQILALVIGSNKVLELWNPMCKANITSSYRAHDGIISSLAGLRGKGIIASVSHDRWIKIWS
ncbi:uncharacterized protein LOC125811934 [Solanum verrucosum]|uniref:uncharacterized protein LOC125811934 n=1 Tax=Solanum verrucosum TaxID=315347 RepID=UPI0020CFEBF9|nr:uncharacterized protein LOC125811934 [Solanum verrucosum]